MVKSRNDFFKTESRKCREGLNRLNNFEVFGVEKVDKYFAHGCHGVDNTTPFVSVTFIKNGNPRHL